jgi:hypothetical protein
VSEFSQPPLLPKSLRRRRPPLGVLVRRWLLVLLIVAGVIFGLTQLVSATFGSSPSESNNPTASPTESKKERPDAVARCGDSDLLVQVFTEPESIAKGEAIIFTTNITSIAVESCFRDMGASANEIFITDANGKKLWSSNRCPVNKKQNLVTVNPGDVYKVALEWAGNKNPKKCGTVAAPLNRGEYQVFASNSSALSEPATITIQ